MWEQIAIFAALWALKTGISYGVKHSKLTENTIDDVIFNSADKLVSGISNILKFKK